MLLYILCRCRFCATFPSSQDNSNSPKRNPRHKINTHFFRSGLARIVAVNLRGRPAVMLPPLDSPPPPEAPQFLKRPKSPNSSDHHRCTKTNPLYSVQILISTHPRTWLLLSILFLQIFLLFTIRSLPLSFSTAGATAGAAGLPSSNEASPAPIADDSLCNFGKVYVYDLPPMFNRELRENCEDLSPWSSRCDALANGGFGQRAATGLAGVVPESLLQTWYWTDQFATEIIFHNRVLGHKCRTSDPESATAFYIPFYAGLAVGKFLWLNYTALERDLHCNTLLKWVQDQPYWKRSNGWDHFITLGRITWDFRRSKNKDWGSSFIYMPAMKNVTRLLIERNPWDYFDVGVPYPTGFHPGTATDVRAWQDFVRTRNRTTLFSFAGATRGAIRNDFRGLVLKHCWNESDACRVVDCAGSRCSNGTADILETFLGSHFCLQPRGDSFTRRSIFDCMVAGSVPVFFWRRTAYYQYEWFLPVEPESYSVFIDRNEVKNGTSIRGVLESFSKEEVRKMREKVIDYIPKLVYAEREKGGLEGFRDAFDVAIEGVLRRFKEGQRWK